MNYLKTKKKGFALITFVLTAVLIAGMLISCGGASGQKESTTTLESSSVKDLTPPTTNSKTAGSPALQESSNEKTDSGSYVGFADSNSIEIRISGIQDEKLAFRVFKVTEVIKQQIDKLGLKKDDQVKITYYEQQVGQPVISSIEKLN